jgi:hypothetical protein
VGRLLTQRETGVGNMGDVTDPKSAARFDGGGGGFQLRWIKGLASGGTGSATLSLKLDHSERSRHFDWNEGAPWSAFGADATLSDIDWRVSAEDTDRYTYQPGDVLVFEWTNPDPGNMRWALEVGYIPTNG